MFQFSVPCLMGVEGLLADELQYKGFQQVRAENGRVLFSGGAGDCARANLQLRCGERVLLRLGAFSARTFDQLFEGVKALPWEEFVGEKDAFPVKGFSIRSQLHSVPDCQRIVKKAAVERLRRAYGGNWLEETGPRRQIQFSLLNDQCEIFLDTTGAPLYKRGYKLEQNEASLRETLAASLVKLARWKGREWFIDPFCGSGTIAIEAAQAALNIAPGLNRAFDAQRWDDSFRSAFDRAREEAQDGQRRQKLPILACDRDPNCVRLTRENAARAGVGDCMEYAVQDALEVDWAARTGVMITDPPYGLRLMDQQQARALYQNLGRAMRDSRVKIYLLSADEQFESWFGRKADKRRKLYNGMVKCSLYQYFKG